MASPVTDLHLKQYGEGAPVVCIHGGPGLGLKPFTPSLLDISGEYALTLYDQRGCGASPSFAAEEDSPLERHLEDLLSIISSTSGQKPILLGHSYGCYIALSLALSHPNALSGLVLVSPATPYMETAEQLQAWYRHFTPEMKRQVGRITMSSADAEERANRRLEIVLPLYFEDHAALEVFHKLGIRVPGDQLQTFGERWLPQDLRPLLNTIPVPVSIITGALDKRTPPEYAQEVQRHLPQSHIRLMPRCGHFPFMESRVDFIEILRQELSRITRGG